ncbi:LUD domain-containing protein [Aureivirga marina]|uniref:LUD domain-containing protein n=1 Tax=Aureivirga marina TaxID=1182451 RepID=UPI0018CA03FE|nr:LUD domain-containing protein [Aureivirga marina]
MNFFKKLFKTKESSSEDNISEEPKEKLSLDDFFVHNFIEKGGKFIYCTHLNEVRENLKNILEENNWETITCMNHHLAQYIPSLEIQYDYREDSPIFTACEQLIAHDGSILLSSNQLKDNKIDKLPKNFIIYATTSQIVQNSGESLTSIKNKYKNNIPSNISAIKSYKLHDDTEDDLTRNNNNAKNLYLLLFEDL